MTLKTQMPTGYLRFVRFYAWRGLRTPVPQLNDPIRGTPCCTRALPSMLARVIRVLDDTVLTARREFLLRLKLPRYIACNCHSLLSVLTSRWLFKC